MTRSRKDEVTSAYNTLRSERPWHHEQSIMLHHRVLPHATLSPWLNDIEFTEIYESVKSNTLVDIYRCYELWVLAKQSIKTDGAVLEVGVWRGGTGAIMAKATQNTDKKVFLADTFHGVVKAGPQDTTYKGGEHADTSSEVVSNLLNSLDLKNAQILEGVFPEQNSHLLTGKIALLHCDVDVYQSTKDIVDWCLPRMLPGAVLVFDDYGFFGCEGVARFCQELKTKADLIFVHNLNGHAIFIKIK